MVTRYHVRATLLPHGDRPVDLWIVDGRITFVPQDGSEELATPGGYLLPGFVDAHVHATYFDWKRHGLPVGTRELVDANRRDGAERGVLVMRDAGALLRRGETEIATLGGIRADDGGARLHAAGQPFGGPGFTGIQQVVSEGELAAAAAAQTRAAAAVQQVGSHWVKVIMENLPAPPEGDEAAGVNFSEPTMRAGVDAVHGAGGKVAVHAFSRTASRVAVRAGVDSLEHGWQIDEPVLAEMAAAQVVWVPTIIGAENMERGMGAEGDAGRRVVREALDQTRAMLPIARRLGITILAGSDGWGQLADELDALIRYGLTPMEALVAGSTAGREFLGEPGVEEGACADLIHFAGDPRLDPAHLRRAEVLMLDGRRFQRRD